jgi:hypothetical protein
LAFPYVEIYFGLVGASSQKTFSADVFPASHQVADIRAQRPHRSFAELPRPAVECVHHLWCVTIAHRNKFLSTTLYPSKMSSPTRALTVGTPGSPSSARVPQVYQIDFTAVASGKRIASSKRRVRW